MAQHKHTERMSAKVLRAFRYVELKGTNDNDKYFMMYDVKNKDILSSKQYLNRLNNPTDWTLNFVKISFIHHVLFVK